MKHKWFQGWYLRRECSQDLNLQQWDILSRSLNALMIAPDSFSANMYSKVNKNVLLMLQAHLKGICNYFKVAYPESGWCASWLLRTCGHLSKTVLYSHNHPLLCSFRVRQLSKCFLWENLYLSTWQTNFLQSRLCEKHHLKRKRVGKRECSTHNSFRYSSQGAVNKLYCLCILYFLYSSSRDQSFLYRL